jgi:hypothetical protein
MPNWIGLLKGICMPPDTFSMVKTLSITKHADGIATALVNGASSWHLGSSCNEKFFTVFGKLI